MFEEISFSEYAQQSLKGLCLITLCYLFYWRVIDYIHAVWFYGRQGRDVAALTPGHLPFIGNLINIIKSMIKSHK